MARKSDSKRDTKSDHQCVLSIKSVFMNLETQVKFFFRKSKHVVRDCNKTNKIRVVDILEVQ